MLSSTVTSPLKSSTLLSIDFSFPTLFSNKTLGFSKTIKTLQLQSHSINFQIQPFTSLYSSVRNSKIVPMFASRSTGIADEVLPPALDATSDPPPVFDGTTRLYISYTCPYAQRAWITRNCKGLQDVIKLVPIDLENRPAWYKEKVYPPNKVPSLEHNNEVKGESLDLMKYIDSNFDGPSLFPNDPSKIELAEELFAFADKFYKALASVLKGEANEAGDVVDLVEASLSKFDDGPFFLGTFSLVDIAYAPLIERFRPALLDLRNYDITAGRPNLAAWIEEMNKNEAYTQTRGDPKEHVERYRKRFLGKL